MQCLRGPLNDLVAVLWIAGISYTRPHGMKRSFASARRGWRASGGE